MCKQNQEDAKKIFKKECKKSKYKSSVVLAIIYTKL